MNKAYIKKLFYCPVKSLSFNESKSLKIINNLGIKNDRSIAFTRGLNRKSSIKFNNSKDRNLNFFLTLRNSPYLKKYNFLFKDRHKIGKVFSKTEFMIIFLQRNKNNKFKNVFKRNIIDIYKKYFDSLDYDIFKKII